MKNDVIIIGGGAAGLCAAVALKKKSPRLSVRLLEAMPRVGKKLALTGNGRCNITNRDIKPGRYHGKNPEFCRYALEKYSGHETESFFSGIGVSFSYEGEKAYPASFQAASVVDCLRFAADEAGVTVMTETKVTKIQTSGGLFKVIAGNMNFMAENVIVAAGLLSGGDRLGCDGEMLELLKKAGFKAVKLKPAIVQLKTGTDTVKQLKGIKTDALVTLEKDGKTLKSDFGEVLFCDYGLSGPPVLQVSGALPENPAGCTVSLDLYPDISAEELADTLFKRAKNLGARQLDEFFTGMLNKRLGQVILKAAGLKLSDYVSSLDSGSVLKTADFLKKFRFNVTGTTGFLNSQVTSGGLDTSQFDSKTMMSRECPGLYAIGEILDIDGDCGGFNLQWAWSSALCAADAITGRK